MTTATKSKRYWFECDNGRRWSECSRPETKAHKAYGPESNHGDICNFSGCLPDHKIKLIKITDIDDDSIYGWFRGWQENWEESPVYKSLS